MKSLSEMSAKELLTLQLKQMIAMREFNHIKQRILTVEEQLQLVDVEYAKKKMTLYRARTGVYNDLIADYKLSLDKIVEAEDKDVVDLDYELVEREEDSPSFTLKEAREEETKSLLEVEIENFNKTTDKEEEKIEQLKTIVIKDDSSLSDNKTPKMVEVKEKKNTLNGKPWMSPGL